MICFNPTTTSYHNAFKFKYSYGVSTRQDKPVSPYSVVKGQGSHILTFSYSDSHSSKDKWGLYQTRASLQIDSSSNIYLTGTTIRVVDNVDGHFKLHIDGGEANGKWISYNNVSDYNISVDNKSGKITVNEVKKGMVDNSSKPKADAWLKILSMSDFDKSLNGVRNKIKPLFVNRLQKKAPKISQRLNGSNSWVNALSYLDYSLYGCQCVYVCVVSGVPRRQELPLQRRVLLIVC